jgi:hypothetical protein
MMHASDEEGADGPTAQTGAIDGHTRPTAATRKAPSGFGQRAADGLLRQTQQKAAHRGVVRDLVQSQGPTQFPMLVQAHLGLTKGPVLVPHQAEDGQQLRLGELVFAEAGSVTGQDGRGDLEGKTRERHESNLGHSHLLPSQKTTVLALRLPQSSQ